ncbi:uncharacterized protein LOC111002675 [Pieris rapae]|uniref:uncharacterized protein LOC111002675 n=1 Tax=Pieris rapae TaxID=64459 RepID=UPI001E27B7F6|nr:uncharacterized protein LOC111002675 [Pieris rapae]
MSEEVHITSKHLTTTEEEFEGFQANSIYEEEEFITLSDLVSPEEEVTEYSYNCAAVLENSDISENLRYEQNDDLDVGLSEIKIDGNSLQHFNSNYTQDYVEPQLQTKKRGCITETELIIKSQTAATILTTKRGRGRGRGGVQGRGRGKGNAGVRGKGRGGVQGKGRGGRGGQRERGGALRGRGRGGLRVRSRKGLQDRGSVGPQGISMEALPDISEKNCNNETLTETVKSPSSSSYETPMEIKPCVSVKKSKRGRKSENVSNYDQTDSQLVLTNAIDVTSTKSNLSNSEKKPKRGRAKPTIESVTTSHITESNNSNNSNSGDRKVTKKKGRKTKSKQNIDNVNCDISEINMTAVITDITSSIENDPLIKDNNKGDIQKNIIDSSSIAIENKENDENSDMGDDICLSELKSQLENVVSDIEKNNFPSENDLHSRNSGSNESSNILTENLLNIPLPGNTENNIVEPTKNEIKENDKMEIKNLASSPNFLETKRPSRNRNKPVFKYDETGSEDEDPFANIELSDDEPNKKKKGKYNSDDEYVPGKQRTKNSSDSDDFENENEGKCKKRKFFDKYGKIRSPKKKRSQKLIDVQEHKGDSSDIIDIEDSLKSSVVLKSSRDDITDFLAKKIQGTDIKIFKAKPTGTSQTSFEIPIIDPNEPKKCVESSAQTNSINIKSAGVQTDTQYECGMMKEVTLSSIQAEKACEFLKNIVSTTAELGELMTQKSQEFIAKKINTDHVTDTLKMDYCVKKSFLLFKLAKHNLLQMEEDLEKQYEDFLKTNNLIQYREQKKEITPQYREDSDCEIIEVADSVSKKRSSKEKAFNPKTVFLNKELSIKIAKKTQEQPAKQKEKINVKGKHTVWINDSIMVKKVKPTQSFLAQDSRNKKPPDYVTLEMVKKFFDDYTKQKMLLICKRLNSVKWLSSYQEIICNYFIKGTSDIGSSQITENSAASNCLLRTNNISHIMKSDKLRKKRENDMMNPKTLLTLCIESFQNQYHKPNPKTLFTLCVGSFQEPSKRFSPKSLFTLCVESFQKSSHDPKSLITTCIEVIQNQILYRNASSVKIDYHQQDDSITPYFQNNKVKSLKFLCLVNLNKLFMINCTQSNIFNIDTSHIELDNRSPKPEVKCLSTLCFMKIQGHYLPNNQNNYVNSLSLITLQIINKLMSNQLVNTNYNSQNNVRRQMERTQDTLYLKLNLNEQVVTTELNEVGDYEKDSDSDDYSDYNSESNYAEKATEATSWVSKVQLHDLHSGAQSLLHSGNQEDTNIIYNVSSKVCRLEQIKIEPIEPEITTSLEAVKVEPFDVTDNNESIIASSSFLTKEEFIDHISEENRPQVTKGSFSSFDVDVFESFVQSNRMIEDINTTNLISHPDEIYSQSSQRIRRQYDPDSDEENINSVDSMGLLVPQSIEQAKDSLLGNSSDDGVQHMDKAVKKRYFRSQSGKKMTKGLTNTTEKNFIGKEVENCARKMRGKIRLEEKRDCDTPLISRKTRQAELPETNDNKRVAENIAKPSTNENIISEKEIQCNDVDSTEIITRDNSKNSRRTKNWHKNSDNNHDNSLNYDLDVPSELLECEPDISIGTNNICSVKFKETNINKCKPTSEQNLEVNMKNELKCVERNGWKCYEIDHKDSKLYDEVSIALEKLPESFIKTYIRFQGITDKSEDDTEVDRLTNLNSLHRHLPKGKESRTIRERKSFKKIKNVVIKQESNDNNNDNEHFAELTPSEDETADILVPEVQDTDNKLAKNLLLGDDESDTEQVNKSNVCIDVKQEPETSQGTKIHSSTKTKVAMTADGLDVMLTADIMMNKELTLLHTPVALKEEVAPTDSKDLQKIRNSFKAGVKKSRQSAPKDDDDSSSEEEKQWVNRKEKMLKRMGKKQEITQEDEAKGAKRVSEFIEKCCDGPRPVRGRGKRSRKKLLEKRKQMKVLAKELLFESGSGKRSSQTYGKGRRNIRKVIDKKSLQRDTVRANMQEFERKQRLAHRLLELRERLGCEEGVNVVVINGELCLEYDFDKNAPVASVHPYFTGVMKAHQYEGVKFMWDACFETVERVSGGHPGSGCILAHCMGLGKTLQVLALLHTVLTHPMLNMRRVLVCCPLSTVLNWVDEIHKWIGPVTNEIKVFELSKLKKTYERAYQLEDWYSGGGIFIVGYELFRSLTTLDADIDDVRPTIIKKIRTALLEPGPDVVICDEGHLLKNDSSVLAVAMSRVTTKRRIVLTGTPMQNNLREYYCMVNFVKPHLLGTYYEFSNRFENPIMNGQHRDSIEEDIRLMKTRTHILHKVLEGCLQRQEASVLYPYLPKKYEYTVFIPLTVCQRNMYKHYLENYARRGRQMVLKDFHTLQKIWTHPQVLHNFQTKARDEENKNIKVEKLEDDLAHEDIAASEDVKPAPTEVWWPQYLEGGDTLDSLHCSNKFQVVFDLLDECVALGDKVLIFSTSLFTMDTLEYFLRSINKWSLGRDYYRLDGSVPAEVRQKWCREFNAPQNHRTKLFLISTRAGCLGLNMTAANRVIILDTSWNPAHDIQSIFRVYRFGQKKDCFIYRLVAMGTMEQKMYERSVTKQAVSCRVVDEQQIDRHYNSAELTELYSWDEEGWGVLAGMAPGVRDPALLRVAGAGAVHAVREHDSLLRGSEPALPEDERAAAWQQFQLEHAEGHRAHVVTAAKRMDQANRRLDAKPPAGAFEALASTEPVATSKTARPKKRASSADVPDRPEREDPPGDDDAEHELVKKIMKILISHKFHETAKPEEITALVANIRRLVVSGMSGDISVDEPVASSIAAVLLRDLNSASDLPAAAGDVPVPEGDRLSAGVGAGTAHDTDSASDRKKRSTRRAALRAERTFEIIDDDPSNHAEDVEWDAGEGCKKKSKCKHKESENVRPVSSLSVETSRKLPCSIVISDDEVDDSPVSTLEKRNEVKTDSRREKIKLKRSSKRDVEIPPAEETDRAEAVPLHPSLLTDDNFIKIVAHTYLKGNPMLTEDAAVMAAHYSTSKALKELQSSGNPITDGPIYDVAVKVLGKTLLKKMHLNKYVSSACASTRDKEAKAQTSTAIKPNHQVVAASTPPSTNAQVITDDEDDLQIVIPKENPPKKKPFVGPKSRKLQMEGKQTKVSPPTTASVEKPETSRPEASKIFPVGMFIGPGPGSPAKKSSFVEECILPDDDDDVNLAPVHPSSIPKCTPVQSASQNRLQSTRQPTRESTLARGPEADTQIKYPKLLPKPHTIPLPVQNCPSKQTASVSNASTAVRRVPNEKIAPNTRVKIVEKVSEASGSSQPKTASVAFDSEPICLSDSDDDSSVNPEGVEIPVSLTSSFRQAPDALPTSGPLLLQTASFKANSPFGLPPAIKNMLDPTKKYYWIPSSSLPFLQKQNVVLKDASIPGVNTNSVSSVYTHCTPSVNVYSVPVENDILPKENPLASNVLTGDGQLHVRRVSTTASHPTIAQPLPKAAHVTYGTRQNIASKAKSTAGCASSSVVKIHKRESRVEIKSNNKPGTVSARSSIPETNRKQNTVSKQGLPDIEILDDDPPPTTSTTTNRTYRTIRSPTPPDDDPMSIFKNVVHIQAPQPDIIEAIGTAKRTVPENPPTKSKTASLQKHNISQKPSVSLQSEHKKKLNDLRSQPTSTLIKKTATSVSKKPASVTLDLTDLESSEFDKKRLRLDLLKRLEKAKWANANFKTNLNTQTNASNASTDLRGRGSSRVKQTATNASTEQKACSFVDLTAFPVNTPTNTPNMDNKRPSPWSKRDIKKPKRLQTLEDFDLDDIDDITELE